MVAFHPGLNQTAVVQYGHGHQAVEITFTATQGDLEHLELWTDLPDGEWKAIPFVIDAATPTEADAAAAAASGEAITIKSSLEPLPSTGASPTVHQATAKTSVSIPTSAQSYSYTFRRSPNGNVEWLGDMGSNGTIVFQQAEIGQGSIFEDALNETVHVDHEKLDGVRGVGIELVEGTPKFQYLPSTNHSSLSLILLEPSNPPPSFYSHIPPSPWSRAVIAKSNQGAQLAATPSASFASCLNRIDPKSAFKPVSLGLDSDRGLGLWYDHHLIVYDPLPSPDSVYTIENRDQVAVFSDGFDTPPSFTSSDIRLRLNPDADSTGALGKVLQVIQAQKLDGILICSLNATYTASVSAPTSPEVATAEVEGSMSFWAKIATSLKTFWTVYVLGLFTSAFSTCSQSSGDESEDDDRTVVGERTPLLRQTSLSKAAATSDQASGYDFTFTAPPYTFAISDLSSLQRLRFAAAENNEDLSPTVIAQSSTAALISVESETPTISVHLA